MRFDSPCSEMVYDAGRLQEDANVKLFLRHAIRYDNPVNGDYSSLLLTPEGIRMAQKIGRSIDRPLGSLCASTVEHCRQTVREIARGTGRFYRLLARGRKEVPKLVNSRQMHLLVTANVNAIVSAIEHDFTEQETGCFSRFLFGIQLASANQRQGGAADYAAVAKCL